jgi:2-desacetyl-2-hydroxyethyl bacteriochlorophyllide A dehydrogenase
MSMKAVRLVEPGRPLEMQELPIPEPGLDDVLVRVKAAGVCHSDAHYRAGVSPVHPLPLTLGHEVAGVIEERGRNVTALQVGDRVCVHYMVTCGNCTYCNMGSEQFCTTGKMIGKYTDGGYAEYINIPARSAFVLPDEIPFEQGAIMMCSSATSFHALRKGRMQPGETLAVFGVGGLGMSAVQLARAFGALDVYAVDIVPSKLALAEKFGAIPVNAKETDPVAEIKRLTQGRGVDVALELIGLPLTVKQSIDALAVFGRAVAVGLSDKTVEISVYRDVMGKEGELIGASDHLASELPALIELARRGVLDLSEVVTGTLPLDAEAINAALDRLDSYGSDVRLVIQP